MAVFIIVGSHEKIKIYRNPNSGDFESSVAITDLLRHHGISGTTLFKWRLKYGGLEASELKRLK
jgi:transposase-like protein